GLGHGFCALTDDATVVYLCSTVYNPSVEHGVHPLDPDLQIAWPAAAPVLSPRDAAAPPLAEARLPSYQDCLARYRTLREGGREGACAPAGRGQRDSSSVGMPGGVKPMTWP